MDSPLIPADEILTATRTKCACMWQNLPRGQGNKSPQDEGGVHKCISGHPSMLCGLGDTCYKILARVNPSVPRTHAGFIEMQRVPPNS